jgi:osmoprotectant transport system substrate-binding protein
VNKNRLMAAALAVTLAACGGTGTDQPGTADSDRIRIASFDFEESRLVAELYAQQLESAGFEVDRVGVVGPREVVAPALEQGHFDLVPEYVGSAATHFGAATIDTPGLAAALEERDLVILDAAPAEDVNVFVVTEATASAHDLVAISDLAGVAAGFRIGGPVECPDRPYCLAGLHATYGLTFAEFVPHRTLAVTAEALRRAEVDVGVMFSTAGELTSGAFVVLDDDRDLQPPENIVPVARRATVERWGTEFVAALDSLSRAITVTALQQMNRRVEVGAPVADAAAAWLLSVDLPAG